MDQLKSDSQKMEKIDLDKDGKISMEEWNLAVMKVEQGLLQEKISSIQTDVRRYPPSHKAVLC